MDHPPISTGGILSPEDPRDWNLASVGAPTAYAASCFLDTDWMVASMQDQIGCCEGCTGEEAVRQIIYLTTGKKCNPGTADELSWRFVYAMAKALEGTVQATGDYTQFARTAGANDGTYSALIAQVIRKYGVPLAKFCPNDTSLTPDAFCYGRVLANIPAAAIADAASRKSGADLAVAPTADGLKQAITYAKANNGAVMILRSIGDSYWKDATGVTTYDPKRILPIRVVPPTSGHEEMLTGYDTEPGTGRERIYWLNHWSPAWANNGRGWEYADVWLPHIVELRVIVAALPPASTGFRYAFTKQLSEGAQGPDVVALQHVLDLEGCYDYAGTPKYTGNYVKGGYTFKGVLKLQEKYASEILVPVGLKVGTGEVGPQTLKWLAAHYGP